MDLIYKFNIQSPRHLTLVSLNEFVFWSVHWKKNLFWEVWYHWTPELLFSSLCLNCAFLFKPENLNYYLYHCAQTVTFFSNLSHVFFGKSGTVEHLNYYSDHCAQTVTFFSNLNHVFFGKSGTVEHLNYDSDHCAQTVLFFSNLNTSIIVHIIVPKLWLSFQT